MNNEEINAFQRECFILSFSIHTSYTAVKTKLKKRNPASARPDLRWVPGPVAAGGDGPAQGLVGTLLHTGQAPPPRPARVRHNLVEGKRRQGWRQHLLDS